MVYDSVYALADEIKDGEEYKQYAEAKEIAFADETTAALIRDYQRLTVETEMYMAAGQTPPPESAEKLSKLLGLLQLDARAMAFLLSEHRFNSVMSDVFRILTESVGLKLDFLSQNEQ